jgi:hypothetical protein
MSHNASEIVGYGTSGANSDNLFALYNASDVLVYAIDTTGTVVTGGSGGSGPIATTGQISSSPTVTTATAANYRAIDGELTLSFAGSVIITGSVASVRGNTTIASGTTVAAGFVYGTQGKVTIVGTNSTANYVCGILGQLDTSSATALGTGPLAAIWGDMGATSTATTDSGADIIKLTNTTGCAINSAVYVNAKASFFADLVEVAAAGTWIVAGAVGGSQDKKLKIKLNGTTYYIACNTA